MDIEISHGSYWPVEPRFTPVAGLDGAGQLQPLRFGAGGLQVSVAPQEVLPTVGVTHRVRAAFARPANTSGYAAGDAVGDSTSAPTLLALPDVARVAGGGGVILSLRLTLGAAAAAGHGFRVWLYHETVAPVADQAPYPLLYADEGKRLGSVDFVPVGGGTGSDAASDLVTGLNLPYHAAAGARALYAVVVSLDAWTPTASMGVSLEVGVSND